MATKIKHLKDEEGKFYPYTHESAVVTDDGTKLGDKLTQLDLKVGDVSQLDEKVAAEDLVKAINKAAQQGGGGGGADLSKATLVSSFELTEDIDQFEIPISEWGMYVFFGEFMNNSDNAALTNQYNGLMAHLNVVKNNDPIVFTGGKFLTITHTNSVSFKVFICKDFSVCFGATAVGWNSYYTQEYSNQRQNDSRFVEHKQTSPQKLIFNQSHGTAKLLTRSKIKLYKIG